MRLSVLLAAVGILGSFTYLNVTAQCGCGANSDVDADEDGYCSVDDCDDNDPETFPGAPEQCDGQDNDCDGAVPAFESDLDRDGVAECAQDCDDLNPQTYPGANERCDGQDNNCDGLVPSSEIDSDGDGFSVCEGDCNDADDRIYPGADERCNGLDDDCDSSVPSSEADADQDGVRVCAGDCDDSAATTFPGASELCDGQDQDCDGLADVTVNGSSGWQRSVCGAIMTGGSSFDTFGVDQPSVLFNSSRGIFQMWYRATDAALIQTIGYAESPDGTIWTRDAVPVLRPGTSTAFDGLNVGFPSVLLRDGVYHLWYQGQDTSKKLRIGYATSTDGRNWTRSPTPVLDISTSGWDTRAVQAPSVLWDSALGQFRMWYTGSDGTYLRTGYATSTNGSSWVKHSSYVLNVGGAGSWDDKRAVFARVHVFSGMLHMWYSGDDASLTYTYDIGYASSSDGIAWTKLEEPVFRPVSGTGFDNFMVYASDVIELSDGYSMYYSGATSLNGPYAIGLARNQSPDANLLAPADDSAYRQGEPIEFSLIVRDAADPRDIVTWWSSDRDGLFASASPDFDGVVRFSETGLSPGIHLISGVALDAGGLVSVHERLIEVF